MKQALFWLAVFGSVAGLLVLPWMVFVYAPIDEQLYFNQKIFYYHVPASMVMFVSVFVAGIASIQFLRTRKSEWDDVAWAAGDLVVVLGAIMMTSGPIWAKIAWGRWWVWEARLTNALLLWMIFLAYAIVRRFGGPGSERLAAGLAIFGMADVPLVYFAVNMWKTMHPTNEVVPGLQGEMRIVFWTAFLTYIFMYCVLLRARVWVGRNARRLDRAGELAVEAGYYD